MEVQDQLPDGWEWRQIGDVILDAQAGFSSGQKDVPGGIPHLRMNNITSRCTLDLSELRTVPPELAKPRHYLRPNDVLVCHTNSAKLVGKTALYDAPDGERAFSNHLTRLRVNPDVVDPRWLWRGLTVLWRDRYFETRCKKWVNQATIEREVLLSAPLPLPPLPEQQRLVEKIERLLEQSRTAREALERIPPLLKRFRQAVLAKAFRGELTERDPNDEPASVLVERLEAMHEAGGRGHGGKAAEPSSEGHHFDEASLPHQWAVAELNLLCEPGRPITYGILKPGPAVPGGVPYVRVADYPQDRIEMSTIRRTTPSIEQEYRRSRLRAGDLLLSIRGTSGRVCSVPPILDGANITQDSARIAVNGEILPRYIEWFLRSPDLQRRLRKLAKGVAVKGVNIGDVRVLRVPLPPRDEQRRVVARVDALLAQANAIEEAVANAGRQTRKMDQAVLARAFRGEL